MTRLNTRLQVESALLSVTGNYSWSWDRRTQALIAGLPRKRPHLHPRHSVAALTEADYAALLDDASFIAGLEAAVERIPQPDASPDAEIAYFSMEFGVSETLPQYSGGLGILAGDHLKAASDLALPLVGVGLFYRHGFFRQSVTDERQREHYECSDPRSLGLVEAPVVVDVPLDDRTVQARVWLATIGKTKLYMLDTDVETNSDADRRITDRLYSGDLEHRIEQEMVMGVGGVRTLRRLGITPSVFHLNEGHAGFLLLELIATEIESGSSFDEAVEMTRPKILFTTHTPVPAGIDRFPRDIASRYLAPWAARLGVPVDDLLDLARMDGDDSFNMAAFCLGLASRSNGVSKLHGEVSREMFAAVPGGPDITSVTNGVHARTWVANPLQALLERAIGPDWGSDSHRSWDAVDAIEDADLRLVRSTGRRRLIDLVNDRVGTDHRLDDEALTIGFARRFATYKRADLLLRKIDMLMELLANEECPVQFVFAGKAHPADEAGKEILRRVVEFAHSEASRGRFVFIPDYDMEVARSMYAGCDVWLNNPIRPNEASGTSGEKAALNGGLNFSVLDGWWDECFDGENGWCIETSTASDSAVRDDEEAASLYKTLTEELAPLFYEDDASPSAAWLQKVRHNWKSLGPFVTASRMVAEYDERLYRPGSRA